MKVEVDVLGSPFLMVLISLWTSSNIKLELEISELRSYVKVEVDALGYPSLIVLMVSVDVRATVEEGEHG